MDHLATVVGGKTSLGSAQAYKNTENQLSRQPDGWFCFCVPLLFPIGLAHTIG